MKKSVVGLCVVLFFSFSSFASGPEGGDPLPALADAEANPAPLSEYRSMIGAIQELIQAEDLNERDKGLLARALKADARPALSAPQQSIVALMLSSIEDAKRATLPEQVQVADARFKDEMSLLVGLQPYARGCQPTIGFCHNFMTGSLVLAFFACGIAMFEARDLETKTILGGTAGGLALTASVSWLAGNTRWALAHQNAPVSEYIWSPDFYSRVFRKIKQMGLVFANLKAFLRYHEFTFKRALGTTLSQEAARRAQHRALAASGREVSIELTPVKFSGSSTCSICLDKLTYPAAKIFPSGNEPCECPKAYHLACLKPWMTTHSTCPTCRRVADRMQCVEGTSLV